MVPEVSPMLATSAAPFDSEDYSFEIKWDGIRALAAVEGRSWRLWGRELADYTSRYPELDVLCSLPTGTLLDGELVAFTQGRADLRAIMRRHPLNDPWKIRQARRWCPIHYVVFDLLYLAGKSAMKEPLRKRREMLEKLCARMNLTEVIFSEAVVGNGKAFYEAVVAPGHEGVMAKHRDGVYLPGRRSSSWRKIKPPRASRRANPVSMDVGG